MFKVSVLVSGLLFAIPSFAGLNCASKDIEEAALEAAERITLSAIKDSTNSLGQTAKIAGLEDVRVGQIGNTAESDCNVTEASTAVGAIGGIAVSYSLGCGPILRFNDKNAFVAVARVQQALYPRTEGANRDGKLLTLPVCLQMAK